MDTKPKPSEVDVLKDLDRIRDKTLDLEPLCRGFCSYLTKVLGFDEAHILLRNQENGALENPVPDQGLSELIQKFIARGEKVSWVKPPKDDQVLGINLAPRDAMLGVLLLRSVSALEPDQIKLAELAADEIDSSVEHALTFAQLADRNRELEAIFALDRLRDEHLPFDQMIDRSAQKLMDYIKADGAAVVLFNEASGVVDIRFPSQSDCSDFQQTDCLRALRDLAFRAFKLKSLLSAERLHEAVGSALCAPLILDTNIIGAFVVISRERSAFSALARRLLAAMASQIDTAIFEDMQRQHIKVVFSRYVAADVVEEMLKTDQDFMDDDRKELTVLFSDLRGFTAASERLDTDVLVGMLNEHLSAMTEVVLSNRGTLDKFIGDCVMAFWGAPVAQPDHAYAAVKAAIEMRKAHEKLLEGWKTRGLPEIHIGIGINTGDMFVGNIGDERKSSYTVIGDHVNLAARLEGVARGGEVLITESTLSSTRDRIEFETMEPVRVKGKSDEIPLFNVTKLK